jgi:hypothetical protein
MLQPMRTVKSRRGGSIILFDVFEEGIEERAINRVAVGMILDAEAKGIVPQLDLLDDVVAGMPRLHFETGG